MTGQARIGVLDAEAGPLVDALVATGIDAASIVPVTDAVGDAERLASVDVCLARPDLLDEHLAHLPRLAWVQSTWAGIGPLLPVMARHPGLRVTGVKGIFGPLMAEYVFGWLAALERRLPDYLIQQEQGRWAPLPMRGLAGRRMTLFGLGSIGRHLASVAPAFGMTVVGVSRQGAPVAGVDAVHAVDDRLAAVAGSDYLVSVMPDTPATRGLIDAEVLAALAPGAILVNAGRGSAIDDDALVDAVRRGAVRAAVLDVFRTEPLPEAHPFWRTPGIHVTPHVSAPTRPEDIARLFAANLARWRAGEPLEGRVDPARGY